MVVNRMPALPYWNHNTAYYPWIKRRLLGCRRVLDVGCGDGTLVRYLQEEGRRIVGIDISPTMVARAEADLHGSEIRFALCPFAAYPEDKSLDAVVFVASLHHMEMPASLEKAKRLLAEGGSLLVVGLASPSSLGDHILDCLRVIPARFGSRLHRMRSSEELGIPTNGIYPEMREIRESVRRLLPGAKLRRGLYWRYLLSWKK